MESFLPSEIARLVLGYLEDQKCEEAYDIFLRTSYHLEECVKMREEGRKFRTQVMGLNLIDILYEYSAIYSLIEERLKKVDPETANSLKYSGSLMDKLTFLLNATSSGQTMLFSITLPPGKSPSTVAHVRKRLRTSNGYDKKKDIVRNSNQQNEDNKLINKENENANKTSNLETTSLNSLPGNSKQNSFTDQYDNLEENEIVRTPKRKTLPLNSSRLSRTNSEILEEPEENLDLTVLTKALLDNREIHEKIAENINKELVSKTPDLLCNSQNPISLESNTSVSNFTFELDNAIKKIVEQTETDPVFENILQEVIGPVEETSDGEDRGVIGTSTPTQSSPEIVKKHSLRNRSRNVKKKAEFPITNCSDLISPTKIDNQNAAAVESIILMQSKQEEETSVIKKNELENSSKLPQIAVDMPSCESTTVLNSQSVTIQEGTVENIILNKNKNVMMPQSAAPFVITQSVNYPATSIPDSNIVIVSSKMTSTGSQIVTVQPAQFQITPQTTFISESDILSMPTVIINDEQNPANSFIVPQKAFPTIASTTEVPTVELVNNNKSILKEALKSKNRLIAPKEPLSYTINVHSQPKVAQNLELKSFSSKQEDENIAKSVPMIPLNSEKKEGNMEDKSATPEKSNKKMQKSLSTPRTCRSHIRALDFSTPPKEGSQKSLTSPKTIKSEKITSHRQTRSSIFTSPINLPIATRSPRTKLEGEWDTAELIFASKKAVKKLDISDEDETISENKVFTQESSKSEIIDESKSKVEVSTSKTKPKKLGACWDQDLRAHVEPIEILPKKKKICTKKNKKTKTSDKKLNSNDATNNTEEKPTNETESENNADSSKENVQAYNNLEKNKNPKSENRVTKATRRKRTPKTKNNVKEEVVEVKEENVKEENEENLEQTKELKEGMRNMKPRVNKKCNMTNNISKSTPSQEDKQKSFIDVNTGVVVLSPSMNANKRIFVEQEKSDTKDPQAISQSAIGTLIKYEGNKITPDMIKPSCNNIVTVKRNLTPILETPLKYDSSLLPATPRLLTPFGTDASFTKLLQQNCGSVDFTSILTPSFPLTPSFVLTPNVPGGDSQSSYVSRPTDYSNSSSYYQPSDNEQNQKLEQMFIEEAMKVETEEKYMWTSTSNEGNKTLPLDNKNLKICNKDKSDSLKITNKVEVHDEKENNTNMSIISDCDKIFEDTFESETNTTVIHKTSANLIRGGKHMATLKKLLKPNEESSSSEKSESPENSTKSLTVVKDPIEEQTKSVTEHANSTNSVGNKLKDTRIVQTRKVDSKVTNLHMSLLKELEIKRKRTVSELESEEIKPKRGRKPKSKRKFETSTRVTRSKSISRKKNNEIQKMEELPVPKKKSRTLKKNTSIEDVAARLKKGKNIKDKEKACISQINHTTLTRINTNLVSPNSSIESVDNTELRKTDTIISTEDEEIQELHLSSEEEDNVNVVTNNNEDPNNLVKGLKERGIHLIPKKSVDKSYETPVKDEDNPKIINSQPLNLTTQNSDAKIDLEQNILKNVINRKIKIKSDVYLDSSKKYDVTKILSQNTSDITAAKDNKRENVAKSTNHEINILTVDKPKEIKKELLQDTESVKLNIHVPKILNVSEYSSEFDEGLFHVKIVTEDSPEFIKMEHDENVKITKTINDYNFTVLKKQISAKVFLEELNVEQDRVLSVTPFLELISIQSSVPKMLLKPLEILYNEIIDESSVDTDFVNKQANSPPDELINLKNIDNKLKLVNEKQKIKTVFDCKSSSKKTISLEQYKTKRKPKENLVEKKLQNTVDDFNKKAELNTEGDAVTIFALTEKDKTPKKEIILHDTNTKKRKAETDILKQIAEKKMKPSDNHALLKMKTLDVDSFLSLVHGPSKQTA